MASLQAAASLRLQSVSAGPSSAGADGEFISFKATMRLPIAPIFGSKGENGFPGHDGGMDGVREVLAGWVMRYLPPLRAVLLSFSPTPRFLHPSASFPSSASPFDALPSSSSSSSNPLKNPSGYLASPPPEGEAEGEDGEGETIRLKTLPMVEGSGFTLAMVEWEGVGWRPRVGMKLVGTPTLSTPSHISLLLHNLFNASIPSSHIPSDEYVFDPECDVPGVVTERRNKAVPVRKLEEEVRAKAAGEGEGAEGKEEGEKEGEGEEKKDEEQAEAEKEVEEEEEELFQEKGWWVHQQTREPLGGKEGRIEFTLVGLATSNSLLSCTGSLLSDPFSPSALAALKQPIPDHHHTPTFASASSKGKKRTFDSDEDTGSSSDSETDDDDDDRIGTGIPANGGAKGAPPAVRDATAEVESASERESSRSPSPLPKPVEVGRKGKKEGKKEKKDKEGSRKSKKAKTVA